MSDRSSGGIGLGSVLAAVLSWSSNHSVLLAIVHAICSWLYVAWWCFKHF